MTSGGENKEELYDLILFIWFNIHNNNYGGISYTLKFRWDGL